VNRRALGIAAAYLIAGAVLLFMAYCAWFTLMWGFNPLAIFPLYAVGLLVFAGCIAVAWTLRNSN
jgi:hypothetical protein